MKSLIGLFLFLALSNQCLAQEFTYSQTGLSPDYIVIERDSATALFLYNNCMRWIEETFDNPEKMIIEKEKGEHIKLSGFFKEFTSYEYQENNIKKFDARYTIDLHFKEGQLKFEPVEFEALGSGQDVPMIGLHSTKNDLYKENGEVVDMYSNIPDDVAKVFNHFLNDLRDYEFADMNNGDKW